MPILPADLLEPKGEILPDEHFPNLETVDLTALLQEYLNQAYAKGATDATAPAYCYWRSFMHAYKRMTLAAGRQEVSTITEAWHPSQSEKVFQLMRYWRNEWATAMGIYSPVQKQPSTPVRTTFRM